MSTVRGQEDLIHALTPLDKNIHLASPFCRSCFFCCVASTTRWRQGLGRQAYEESAAGRSARDNRCSGGSQTSNSLVESTTARSFPDLSPMVPRPSIQKPCLANHRRSRCSKEAMPSSLHSTRMEDERIEKEARAHYRTRAATFTLPARVAVL